MARLVWHVDAARDIQLAVEYISRDSLVAAGFFALRITKAAERLTIHPRLGRHVPEITDPSYRELLFQNYRIVYVLTDDKVAIIGVVHAAMDMQRLSHEREWDLT